MPYDLLCFASGNKGKLIEVRGVADQFHQKIAGPLEIADTSSPPDVDETAETYIGNARLKAEAYHKWCNLPSFADDAGLEVDALGGKPGLYSARYSGEDATDAKNRAKLLRELEGVSKRTARFRSVISLYDSGSEVLWVEATVEGEIATEEKGAGGFGYDPLFFIPEFGKTLAELKEEGIPVKTHRVLALEQLFSKI